MPAFDENDCIDRYRKLLVCSPELFANRPADTLKILTNPEDAACAQAEAREYRIRAGLSHHNVRLGLIAEDPYFALLRDAVQFADGRLGIHNRILAPAGFVLVPVMGDNIVLIRHFRHGPRRIMVELPRGMVDPGETLIQAAHRELYEEIGSRTDEFIHLGEVFTMTGLSSEHLVVLFARVDSIHGVDTSDGILSSMAVSTTKVEAMILDGSIVDGVTISALFRARLGGLLPQQMTAPIV